MKKILCFAFLIVFLFSYISAEVSSSSETTFFIRDKNEGSKQTPTDNTGESNSYLWFILALVLIVGGIYFFLKHKGKSLLKRKKQRSLKNQIKRKKKK